MQQAAHPQSSTGQDPAQTMETKLADIDRKLDELAANGKKPETTAKADDKKSDTKKSGILADILKSLFTSLVIFYVTYEVKDSVDMALKERQLQLQNVQAMGALQSALQTPKLDPKKAADTAAQLAAFGRYSIPFFINVLEIGDQVSSDSAEEGLRMVSRSEPSETCKAMGRIIRNHTGLYSRYSHLAALKLLGAVGCTSEQDAVADYVKSMNSPKVLGTWVAPPAPEQSEYRELAEQAATTKSLLDSVPKQSWWRRIGRGNNSR